DLYMTPLQATPPCELILIRFDTSPAARSLLGATRSKQRVQEWSHYAGWKRFLDDCGYAQLPHRIQNARLRLGRDHDDRNCCRGGILLEIADQRPAIHQWHIV